MKKIKPKSADEVYGGMHDGKEKMYPEFKLHHDQLPEAKEMGVGEKHKFTIHAKKVDHSESRLGGNHSTFEIHGIEHHGEVGKNDAEEAGETEEPENEGEEVGENKTDKEWNDEQES